MRQRVDRTSGHELSNAGIVEPQEFAADLGSVLAGHGRRITARYAHLRGDEGRPLQQQWPRAGLVDRHRIPAAHKVNVFGVTLHAEQLPSGNAGRLEPLLQLGRIGAAKPGRKRRIQSLDVLQPAVL